MSRLWLNNDFGPVETISESIMIDHVVFERWYFQHASVAGFEIVETAKKRGFDSTDHFKYCLISHFDRCLKKLKRLLDVNG